MKSDKKQTHTEERAEHEILNSDWTVKAVRFMRGHDAPSMECKLYRGTRAVCVVWDDSWGGGFQYSRIRDNQPHYEQDMKDFEKFCKSFRVPYSFDPTSICEYGKDIVIDILVNHFEAEKQFKRDCRKFSCFILKDHQKGQYTYYQRPYSPKMKEYIEDKYGKDLIEIINERYL